MDLKSRQKIFDDVKWYDSIVAGEDRCGSYEFCCNCNKVEEYPCARAQQRTYAEEENCEQEGVHSSNTIKVATIYVHIGE